MQVLGHKNVKDTTVYINLERAIFKENNDEFSVRAISDLDEACKLLEVGFEYVCDMDGKNCSGNGNNNKMSKSGTKGSLDCSKFKGKYISCRINES